MITVVNLASIKGKRISSIELLLKQELSIVINPTSIEPRMFSSIQLLFGQEWF